jgi:hypothetical protein
LKSSTSATSKVSQKEKIVSSDSGEFLTHNTTDFIMITLACEPENKYV